MQQLLLDDELEKWLNRPLGEYLYLFVDAYYRAGARRWAGVQSGRFIGGGGQFGRKRGDPERFGASERA